jgi:hypothetical protein
MGRRYQFYFPEPNDQELVTRLMPRSRISDSNWQSASSYPTGDSMRQVAFHFQNLPEKPRRRSRITVTLCEDVDHFSLLINGSP